MMSEPRVQVIISGKEGRPLPSGPKDSGRDMMAAEELKKLGVKRLLQARSTLSTMFYNVSMPVTFEGVSYTVTSNRNRREHVQLLQGVSGYLQPSEMSALMGPSGSGKTTLLDVLAGRKTVGRIEGEVRFGGVPPTKAFLRQSCGYVEQQDTLHQNLTVEEMLLFTALLKRPVSESFEEKRDAVEELIERLALTSCRNVLIGSPLARGISGGQAKRCNIGVALVTNPKILFLDEPTSGLDSYTGTAVMSAVKSLSAAGITVVATIHSPTPFCFKLFDQVLLLIRGRLVFFGTNGPDMMSYFSSLCTAAGDLPQLQPGENPSEWIVDVTTQADWQGRTEEFVAAFEASRLRSQADAEAQLLRKPGRGGRRVGGGGSSMRHDTKEPFWWGTWILFRYRALKNYRSFEHQAPRALAPLLFAFIMATLYWKLGDNLSADNAFNITQMLFIWALLSGYTAITYIPSIVLDRPLFYRERSDGLYSVGTYLTAKMTEELLVLFVCSIAGSNLVFWTVRLQGSFALFWLVEFVTGSVGMVLAYFVAAISPTMDIANAVLPAYLTIQLLFMGLVLRWDQIPWYWRWLGYIDFLRYAWGALMKNNFEGDRDVEVFPGTSVLSYYSLQGISKWGWLGIEACFFFAFCLFTFLSLKYVRYVRR